MSFRKTSGSVLKVESVAEGPEAIVPVLVTVESFMEGPGPEAIAVEVLTVESFAEGPEAVVVVVISVVLLIVESFTEGPGPEAKHSLKNQNTQEEQHLLHLSLEGVSS